MQANWAGDFGSVGKAPSELVFVLFDCSLSMRGKPFGYQAMLEMRASGKL